jgi:hypothetical protein
MQNGPRRGVVSAAVALAEEEADQLAYELLAPAADVLARTGDFQGDQQPARLAEVLQSEFGLPQDQSEDYSRLLSPLQWEDPLLRRLRSYKSI